MHWSIVLLCNLFFASGTLHFIVIIAELVYFIFFNNGKRRESVHCDSDSDNDNDFDDVIILIPVCNEDSAILCETLKRCLYLDGHPNILVIENSSDIVLKNKVIDVCNTLDVHCVSIPHLGNKAMALNYYLKNSSKNYKYVAILDVDQQPQRDFVTTLLSFFRKNKNIALVQLPQVFRNKNSCFVSYIYSCMQEIYYKSISAARGSINFAPCFGTNFIIRYDVLEKVGFFDEDCIVEDIATALKIHLLGYTIKYIDMPMVFGIAPENVSGVMIQMKRYTVGANQLLYKMVKNLIYGQYKISSFSVLFNYFHQSLSLVLNSFIFYLSLLGFLLLINISFFYFNLYLLVVFFILNLFIVKSFRVVFGMFGFFLLLPFFLLFSIDLKEYSFRFNVTPKKQYL